MRALGIDPSTTSTGVVLLDAGEVKGTKHSLVVEEVLKPPTSLKGVAKHRWIAMQLMTRVHSFKPNVIVMEGYSLNQQNASSVVPLVELGGILRLMLHLDGLSWYDPRASELKKFVSGKGNAKKSEMMMHVLARWGHKSQNDDTADAYGLACVGLATVGRLEKITKDMLTVVGNLKARDC